MFVVTNVNMLPLATGTGAPIISAAFDGDVLITMIGVMEEVSEAYAAIADVSYERGDEEEGDRYHQATHNILNVLAALDNALQAIDSLDTCPDCGEPKIGHAVTVDPAEFSDENLAQVMEQFSQEG